MDDYRVTMKDEEREIWFLKGRGWIVRPEPLTGDRVTADGFDDDGNLRVIVHITGIQGNGIYFWYEFQDNPNEFDGNEKFGYLVDPVKKVLRSRELD